MSQKLVGIETFSIGKSNTEDATEYCSLMFGHRQTKMKDGRPCVPTGEPFASLFLRPLETGKKEEAIAANQQCKREGRTPDPQGALDADDDLTQTLMSLELPKLGMVTLENQIATLYALDQDVKDFTLLLHALQVFATQKAAAEKPAAGHRYLCATEFKTPVRRTMDESQQSPPILEMQLWNIKATSHHLNQDLIQPLGKAWQPYQLKQKIAATQIKLEQAKSSQASAAGDAATVQEIEGKLAEYRRRWEQVNPDKTKPTNIFARLLRDLDFKNIEVIFSSAKGSRYTPTGGLILSTDSAKTASPYLSQRITMVFHDWQSHQLYLNELEPGTGRLHYKKTAVHHVEHLRTENINDVLNVFAEYQDFAQPEDQRQKTI